MATSQFTSLPEEDQALVLFRVAEKAPENAKPGQLLALAEQFTQQLESHPDVAEHWKRDAETAMLTDSRAKSELFDGVAPPVPLNEQLNRLDSNADKASKEVAGWVFAQYGELAGQIESSIKKHDSRRDFLIRVAAGATSLIIAGACAKNALYPSQPKKWDQKLRDEKVSLLLHEVTAASETDDARNIIAMLASHPELKNLINIPVKTDSFENATSVKLPDNAYLSALDLAVLLTSNTESGSARSITNALLENGATPTKTTLEYIDLQISANHSAELGSLDAVGGYQPEKKVSYLTGLKKELQEKYPNDVQNSQVVPPPETQQTNFQR